MKVVVTGGAGFIGSNLCRRFAEDPNITRVVAIDDLSTGYLENLTGVDGVEMVHGSILNRELLARHFDGAASVVHLAARPSVPRSVADPIATHLVNVDGTINVLEAARSMAEPPQIIFAGSSSVYGSNPELPKRETMATWPASPYAASKLAGEACLLGWSSSFGISVLGFRFFNVFGPFQRPGHAYAAVVPAFLEAALTGKPLPVHGDGTQSRDFTFVGTVCDAIQRAVHERIARRSPVNLAFGTRTTLLAVKAELESLIGHELCAEHQPNRAGDVPHSQADSTVLREILPGLVAPPFTESLGATLLWMREYLQC